MPAKWLICIEGPTASGKSELAVYLAEKFQSEIISADSRQFYKEMNIGTAKPTEEQLLKARHHFISEFSVFEPINASDFEIKAIKLIDQYFKSKQHLIITGGSGLYLEAVIYGFNPIPDVEKETRQMLQDEYEKLGLPAMIEKLKLADPEYCMEADLKNPRRVLRALEICISSGKPFSYFLHLEKPRRSFNNLQIGLNLPLEILHERINHRCDEMMKAGLLAEAESLYHLRNLTALQTIGYQEFFEYFDGHCTLEFAIEKFKQHSRNYAKKQLTWLKRDKNIRWFAPDEREKITNYVESCTNN